MDVGLHKYTIITRKKEGRDLILLWREMTAIITNTSCQSANIIGISIAEIHMRHRVCDVAIKYDCSQIIDA